MKRVSRTNVFYFIIILIVLAMFIGRPGPGGGVEPINFSTLMEKVEEGEVKEATFKGQRITGKLQDGTSFETTGPGYEESVYHTFVENGVTPNFEENEDESVWMTGLFTFDAKSHR